MKFYKSIAPWYDYIFPTSPMQLKFINSKIGDLDNKKIVDVGCGTGNLSILLGEANAITTGLELDSKMVEKAKEKSSTLKNISIVEDNMLNISSLFEPNSIDGVICFGNTLVHLLNDDDILSFLSQCKTILKNNGKLLIQIINYDFILDNKLNGLPTIENDKITFVRDYESREDGLVNFNTKLTVKESGETIENSVALYPARKKELTELIEKSGMEATAFYSAFDGKEYSKTSLPLIIEIKNEI